MPDQPGASQTAGTPCLCFRIRRAAQRIKDFYDETLAPTGVSVAQYALLININRMEGCGTGELARVMKYEKSTLVRTLQPLLNDGFIADRSPGSNRKRQLYITEEGTRVFSKTKLLWSKAQNEIHSRLGGWREQFTVLDTLEVL